MSKLFDSVPEELLEEVAEQVLDDLKQKRRQGLFGDDGLMPRPSVYQELKKPSIQPVEWPEPSDDEFRVCEEDIDHDD